MPNEKTINKLSLRLFVDSNFIGDQSYAAWFLRKLDAQRCIMIQRSDTLKTELEDAQEPKRSTLLGEAHHYPEAFGVVVLGHSRWDASVWPSEQDVQLREELRRIVKPGVTDWSDTRQQHVRDVMHLHTAIRYAAGAFVTSDKGLLAKAEQLKPYIQVWSPRRAAGVAIGRIRTNRRITEARG